jgi:hypothetical protein
MLTKQTVLDKIEVLPRTGHIQVREALETVEDGEVISSKYHRRVVEPDADITGEPELIRNLHAATVSAEHKAAAQARRDAAQAKRPV